MSQEELTNLKARADLLGVRYHPSIGVEALLEKISAVNKPDVEEPIKDTEVETLNQKRYRLKQEAHKLIRVRISCMNPAKAEWPGEIFTVGNASLGTVKRFVPFNNEEGWHIPNIMLQMLRDRQTQIFVSGKSKHGVTIKQAKMIKEFSIEVLPDLTKDELDELARRQAMSHAVD